MKREALFDAPWGTGLRLTTVLSTGILLALPFIGMSLSPNTGFIWFGSMVGLPLAILLGAALFMIRGYELTQGRLSVQRLFWKTVLSLESLQSVEIDPDAMQRSLRTFGNGGLFCFAGKFRSKKLGSYRAYATDPRLAVVLRFRNKVIVVTPDNPKKFAKEIENFK